MYLKHLLALPFFSILLLLIACLDVNGCSCTGPRTFGGKNFQPCGIYWGYPVVFIGQVEKVSYEKATIDNKEYYSRMIAHFSVSKAIRGVETDTVDIETNPNSAACGYPFKEGESYFVYVRRDEKSGKLVEHLCGATVQLTGAEQDIKYLNAIETGEQGSRIYGNATRLIQDSYRSTRRAVGLSEIPIRLRTVKLHERKNKLKYLDKYYKSNTDADGFYIFYGIPDGEYVVEAEIPESFRRLGEDRLYGPPHYIKITNEKSRCGQSNFSVTTLGTIRGRVTNFDGSLPPQQYIWLLPVDENGRVVLDSNYSPAWIFAKDGAYSFDFVAPGNYMLAVNPKMCPNKHYAPQHGRTFYPGVYEASAAKTFTLKESEEKHIDTFSLLPALKERLLSGIVLSADGKPVRGATVFLSDGKGSKCTVLSSLDETKTDEEGRFQLKSYYGFEYKLGAYIETNQSRSKRLYSDLISISSASKVDDIIFTLKHEY